MFELDKWYLDVVTEAGAVLIGYAIHCRFGAASFRYASLLQSAPDQPATDRATLRGTTFPLLEGDHLRWHLPRLRFDGSWHRLGAPVEQTLLDDERGRIEWRCLLPRARVTARLDDTIISGMGYAERLHVTLPLWQLPFSTLRWGRYATTERGLVWIEWSDGLERRWAWSGGREEPSARVEGSGVAGLADGGELRFEDRRVLRDWQVLESAGRILPDALRTRLGPIARLREQKWLSRGTLRQGDRIVDHGWAIHEEVRW